MAVRHLYPWYYNKSWVTNSHTAKLCQIKKKQKFTYSLLGRRSHEERLRSQATRTMTVSGPPTALMYQEISYKPCKTFQELRKWLQQDICTCENISKTVKTSSYIAKKCHVSINHFFQIYLFFNTFEQVFLPFIDHVWARWDRIVSMGSHYEYS